MNHPRQAAVVLLSAALTAVTPSAVAQDAPSGGAAVVMPSQSGEQVYRQICQACHMANGRGASGAAVFPALAANPRLATAAYPITMVLKGNGAMPPFRSALTPEQIAAVVGYVRTHFGNDYAGPVTAADVRALAVDPAEAPEVH